MTSSASCQVGVFGLVRKLGGRVAAIAASLALAAALVVSFPSAAAAQPSPWFYLRAVHTNKCLTVHQANQAPNADMTQYTCKWQQNQQFRRIDGRNIGYKQLQVRHSGLCVTVYRASEANGAEVNQYYCENGYNQNWYGNHEPSRWEVAHSGKCLNVKAASRANNAKVIQWDCVAKGNGLFYIHCRSAACRDYFGKD